MATISADFESRLSAGSLSNASSGVASEASALFRTKRVAEIKLIEARVKAEAEDKSSQLRTMLGTRYRELIHSVDDVSAMDESVRKVREAVDEAQNQANGLRKSLLVEIEHKQHQKESANEEAGEIDKQKAAHSLGLHLKYIVDTREHLFALLDGKNLFEAAMRFAGALSAKQALLDNPDVNKVRRFVDLQWQGVEPFEREIVSSSRAVFAEQGLPVQSYAGALCALVTVSGTEAVTALEEILEGRLTWIRKALSSDSSPADAFASAARAVRDAICDIYVLALRTPSEEDDDNEGYQEVVKLVNMTAPVKNIDSDKVRALLAKWLTTARKLFSEIGAKCLRRVQTGAELKLVSETVDPLSDGSDKLLEQAEASFLGTTADKDSNESLEDLLRAVIRGRAEAITKEIIDSIFATFEKEVVSALETIAGTKTDDGNIGRVLWSEDISPTDSSTLSGASLLGKAGTAKVLGTNLDQALRIHVHEDLERISDRIPEVAPAFRSMWAMRLPQVADDMKRLGQNIEPQLVVSGAGLVKSLDLSPMIEQLFLLGRVAGRSAESEILLDLFCFGTQEGSQGEQAGREAAVAFAKSCEVVSHEIYGIAMISIAKTLGETLTEALVEKKALHRRIGWEKASEEPGAASFPAMASHPLFDFLTNACRVMNYAGGFALPAPVTKHLAQCLTGESRQAYEKAAEACTDSSADSDALLQMVFDLKFLSMVLTDAPLEDTPNVVGGTVRQLEGILISKLDPVDWTASERPLGAAVNAAIAKSSILIGSLLRAGSPAKSTFSRPSLTDGFRASSLLQLAPVAPRFQFLPAPLPSSYQRKTMSTKAALQTLEMETGGIVKAAEVGTGGDGKDDGEVKWMATNLASNLGRFSSKFLFSFGGEQAK